MRSTGLLCVLWAVAPVVVEGYWEMSCSVIQTGRVDPVVSYGSVSQHVHKISGAANININSTFASLRASECTSCSIQADKSAYWTPQLYYQHSSGIYEEVPNSGMAVYYLGRGIGSDGSSAVPFPEGLQMLSGNNFARSYNDTEMTWGNSTFPSRPVADRVSVVCINYKDTIPQSTGLANTTCPDGLRAQIQMQSCWDGKRLSSPDQSHVAYLSQIDNGACPPTHPILLPHLFYEVLYSVDSFSPATDGGKFVFSNGDETGFGFHGDFLNGWDTPTLQSAIKTCLPGTGTGPGTPGDGGVGDCPAFAASNIDDTASRCPERSPVFPCEKVHGTIGSSLPGCITPTGSGPDSNAALTTCVGGNKAACSADYSTTGPKVVSGNDEYQSVGCFTEATGQQALTAKSYSNLTNTVEQCLAFCSGSTYAAVKWGRQCYCGERLNPGSLQVNASDCDMSCSANQWEICGGSSRLNVYLLKNASASSTSLSSASATKSLSSTIVAASSINSSARATSSPTPQSSSTNSSTTKLLTTSTSTSTKKNTTTISIMKISSSSILTTLVALSTAAQAQSTSTSSSPSSFTTSIKAAATSTSPSIVPGDSNFAYYACVNDPSGSRVLPTQLTVSGSKTVENCLAAAAGYAWVGIEYGGECWAGMTLDQTKARNTTSDACKMTCTGNATEICGGPNLLTTYTRQTVMPTEEFSGDIDMGYSYYGCVAEPASGRLLTTQLAANDTMTVKTCLSLVQRANTIDGAGYQYVGLEYGRECWASKKNSSAILVTPDACEMRCKGNATQWCGGSSRLDLYVRMQG